MIEDSTVRAAVVSVLLLGAVLAAPLGCCQPKKEPAAPLDQKAIEVWRKHELVFKLALRGYQKDDDFEKAGVFFERVTGVKIHANFFTLGILPTVETKKDFARIQHWYRMNMHRLYWDTKAGTVRVRP